MDGISKVRQKNLTIEVLFYMKLVCEEMRYKKPSLNF